MACIPVYKGKRFPSTEKLLQYLSTEEGIMAHLADGKDTEFLKAIEGAVSAAEKSAAPTQQGNTEVGKIIGKQFRLLNEGKILDMDGNPIYDMTGGITTNGLENLTNKKYGHSSTRLNEEGSLDVLNNILSTGNIEGWFGTIGVEGAGPWTTGKFFIASNSIDGGSKGKIDPSEVEVILNVGLTPFAQELANKYPQTTIKDYNGNVYTPQKQSNAQQVAAPKPNPFIEKTRKAFNAALKKLGLKAKVKFISDEEAAEIVASGEPVKAMTAGFQTRDGKPIGFAYDTDQVARGRFDFSKLKKIGSGSDRDVYDLGDGKVLKVAKTARGLTQNIYEGDFYLKGIIPEVFERGLNYVVAENTPRMKAADKVPTYYDDGSLRGNEETASYMLNELKDFDQRDFDRKDSVLQSVLTKYGLQDIMSYEVLWPDFIAARNWGYKDGKAYHSDGGTFGGVDMIDSYKNKTNLSDPEFRKIYEESKRLKKQFGDTDKNTMYMRGPSKMMLDGKEVTVQVINADVVNGFYSPLEKIINESKQDKMPAKQWAEKYANSEEAKWTGLKDWLANQTGAVSKADIQAYLKDNRIEVVEVVKGGDAQWQKTGDNYKISFGKSNYTIKYDERQANEEDGEPYGLYLGNSNLRAFESLNEAKEYAKEHYEESNGNMASDTKFSEYQLPGDKKNYKEVLVTMPNKGTPNSVYKSGDGEWAYTDEKGYTEYYYSEKEANEARDKKQYKTPAFKSSHFDEPNILVHLRMNTRTDADGNKVLFLEEVQSDWGQKGKKEGFAKEIEKKDLSDAQIEEWAKNNGYEVKPVIRSNGSVSTQSEIFKNGTRIFGFNTNDTARKIEYLRGEVGKTIGSKPLPLPAQAPFVIDTNAWTKLGLKVALKEAVAQGADKIAWTTGEQQNERYDLRKQVDYVDVFTNDDGTYEIEAVKGNNSISKEKSLKASELEPLLGKDLASKIIEDTKNHKHVLGEENLLKTYRGNDLAVGGKGMKGFYGSPTEGSLGIVGSVAKSLFKQEPGTISFDTGNAKIDAVRYDGSQDISDLPGNDMVENGDWLIKDTKGNFVFTFEGSLSKNDAINEFREASEDTGTQVSEGKGIQAQHSIDVTPELAAQATQGQPLFMKDSKGTILGFVQPQPDGSFKVWIDPATTNAETPIHELAGHIFMPLLKEAAPELHAKGVELIQGTPYQKNAEALGLEGAAASEEALAQAIGEKGKQLTESKRKDFLDWLNGMWKKIGEKLGITKPIKDLTLEEFTDLIAGSIVFGKQFEMKGEAGRDARAELKDNVGPEEFKRMEDIHRNGEKMLKELEGKGLIKIDCP